MEFNIGTILFGIFYSVFIISFFTIFPVALGALYLWFILKMFHRKNLGFWRLIGTSLFSYFSIIMSAIILSFISSLIIISGNINKIDNNIFGLSIWISLSFSIIIGIISGTLCIRKLIKESWGYSLLISFLVIALTIATFYLIMWSPIGSFIIPPEQ